VNDIVVEGSGARC